MKRIPHLLLILLFLSCNKKETSTINSTKVNYRPYIISLEKQKLQIHNDSLKKANSKTIVIPTKGFYSKYNLIIDQNNKLYYYKKDIPKTLCNYGEKENTIPEFIGLKPNELQPVPCKSIEQFVSNKLTELKDNHITLIIASQNDTITNPTLLQFINHIKAPSYLIRRTTQEENFVLQYINHPNRYKANTMPWDSTKTIFTTQL